MQNSSLLANRVKGDRKEALRVLRAAGIADNDGQFAACYRVKEPSSESLMCATLPILGVSSPTAVNRESPMFRIAEFHNTEQAWRTNVPSFRCCVCPTQTGEGGFPLGEAPSSHLWANADPQH